MRKVRTLRHWKQRYDKNAAFIFRRPTVYAGKLYRAGAKIPKALSDHKVKLRRFWESKRIELAEFEAPNVVTGVIESKPKPKPKPKPKRKAKQKKDRVETILDEVNAAVKKELENKSEEDWLADVTS